MDAAQLVSPPPLSSGSLASAHLPLRSITHAPPLWDRSQVLGSSAVATAGYCLPTQPCWPALDAWSALNSSLVGTLIRPDGPLPCEPPTCTDAHWRIEQPAGLMFLNFECVVLCPPSASTSPAPRLTQPSPLAETATASSPTTACTVRLPHPSSRPL